MFPKYNSLTSFYLSQISSLQTVKLYIWSLLSCFQDCISTPRPWLPIPWRLKVLQVILLQDLLLILVCLQIISSLIINSTNRSWILQNRCMQLPKSDRHIKSFTVKLDFKGTRTGIHRYQFLFFLFLYLKGSSKDFDPFPYPWETAMGIKSTIGIMIFKINDYITVF